MAASAVSSSADRKRIAYLSTFPPRECGIATFTEDLIDSIDETTEFRPATVIAVNEKGTIYDYDKRVKCQIRCDFPEDYVQAAHSVNSSKADLVNIQHEFGIFGGEWGEHLQLFLENLEKPVVTTLHTVEPEFPPKARAILQSIAFHSAATVVMAHPAVPILEGYGIPRSKIRVIQHGCPNIAYALSEKIKSSLGLRGRTVLSTFGLISRGKGIEYAIRALPPIVKKEPGTLYIVIGETHPEVRKNEGESYRRKLLNLVDELKLTENVVFHNRFLSKRELIKYLQATDIYLTPYVSPNQISSGTLAYALGAGKAVISTPYLHAKEALANGRGMFCKFRNPASITECIGKLLEEKLRMRMEKRAYRYGQRFVWPSVAKKYGKLFSQNIKASRRT